MTKSQIQKIEWLRKEAEKMAKEYHNNGEVKKFEVTENKYFVGVYIVTGGVGDEGTLGESLARERCHLFIGKRGAITYPIWNDKTHHQISRTFGRFESLWSVSYKQEHNK